MDKSQAEAVKLQILERRNYLKAVEPSLRYSKRNLYGGMQERIRRQEDRSFKKEVCKRDEFLKKKLNVVNKYITERTAYEDALNVPKVPEVSTDPLAEGEFQTQSTPLLIAPTAPNVLLPSALKGNNASNVRRVRRGIRGRR